MTQEPGGRGQAIKLILEVAFNFVLPWACYKLVKAHGGGEVHAILASSAPPMLWSIAEFLRRRRIDALSILVLGGIFLSLAMFAIGGSAKLLLVRESLITGAIGLAFLVSALIRRPLIYVIASAMLARQSATDHAEFVAKRERPGFKRMMGVMSVVWGLGLIGEACLRIALVFALPVSTYLIVAPIAGYGTFGALGIWTYFYAEAARRRAAVA
ncbi:MAG: hypothetical protein B7Z80_03425 [Rhodospirillales bacterium 20-64-7]|nr:MAG: hypothetical protein B7Z80_03425 [Rhodospirillales bacterium 20-64-7]